MHNKKINIKKILDRFKKILPKFNDGRIDYSKAEKALVLTCFVKYRDKILILKRSNKVRTYKGKWNAVAGYLDDLKPLKEKVVEELSEELKIAENNILKLKFGKNYEFFDSKIQKTWIVNPVIVELKEKPKIKLNEEHTKFRWIYPSEIKDYDTVPNLEKSWGNMTRLT